MPDPYKAPDAPPPDSPAPRHSRAGVASFVIGILCILQIVALASLEAVLTSNEIGLPDTEVVSGSVFVGGGVILCILALTGTFLGIEGSRQSDHTRVYGVLGLTINGLFLLGIVGLIVLVAARF